MEEKKLLRKKLRRLCREIPKEKRNILSKQIINKVIASEMFQTAKSVMLYASMENEVQLYDLLDAAVNAQKTVSLPLVTGNGIMKPMRFFSKDDLEIGTYGILEIRKECCREVDVDSIDLVVVPGLAFSRKGERLGRGSGFYDRFLKNKVPHAYRLAVTFDDFLMESLPVEPHDVYMDSVFTETAIVTCRRVDK